MIFQRNTILYLMVLMSLTVLSACAGAAAQAPAPDVGESAPVEIQVTAPAEASLPGYWVEDQPRLDEQGAVAVQITPINLNNPADTLDFSVSLNTHSVDLSMDLSLLATLTTDTGKTVQAAVWGAPVGGHHVSGVLSFPAAVEGQPFLGEANQLTLTITDLDAPERVFIWER